MLFVNVVIMVRPRKLFRWIRKLHKMAGIYPSSKSNQIFSSNCKKFIVLLAMLSLFISSFTYALFEADSTKDYAASLSVSIMVLTNVVFFLINMKEMKNIMKLVQKLEDFIEISKYLAIIII